MKTDTIAAIATAMTVSGIGIIRISGSNAFKIADDIFQAKNRKKKLSEQMSHTIHYGYICEQDEMIDEVLIMLMRGPRSYTGEDTVEIDCHGGIYAMKKVLETVLNHGARPAEPGEFTKRAFLNGRIDLSQAEAVMDVISAKNEYALKSSLSQLKGSVKQKITDIRKKILYHIAYIESALDDPEHISLEGYPQELEKIIKEEKNKIDHLLKSSDEGKMIQEGIKTVIVGKPNAGKSSLLNILANEEKAIVTDVAGTTRDILEETILLQGITLRVLDTAGIRDSEDVVEQIGVDRAIKHVKDADLVLYVVDSSASLDENDDKIIQLIQDRKAIILLNKTDLKPIITVDELEIKTGKKAIPISAKEGTGIEKLEQQIKQMFFQGELLFNDEVYITNIRHKNALLEADNSLSMVLQSIQDQMPEDFFSIDLMSAYEALGSIVGESVGEDLVNEIFSKFCTGK